MEERKAKFIKGLIAACIVLPLILFGVIAVYADYVGPQNRYTTSYTYERKKCFYLARVDYSSCYMTRYTYPDSACMAISDTLGYFSNSSQDCGTSWPVTSCKQEPGRCTITLDTSIVSCSMGQSGCTSTEHTSNLPAASVLGTAVCPLTGDNGWCRATTSLVITASEPVGGYTIQLIEGTRNGVGFTCPIGSSSCTLALPEGPNDYTFWAHSTWGDTSGQGSVSIKVDSLPPLLTRYISGAPGEDDWFVSDVALSLTSSDPSTGSGQASGVASSGVSLDQVSWSPSLTVSADGTYTAYFQARDYAGNTAVTSKPFKVDQTPPVLSVTVPPPGPSGWYAAAPVTVSAAASDPTSGLSSLEYAMDGSLPQTGGTASLSADGAHSVEFKASDQAGNVSASNHLIKIDTTAPAFAPFVSGDSGSGGWYVSAVTVDANASDSGSGIDAVEYSLDSGVSWNSGGSLGFTANGTRSIIFRATDKVGHSSTSATIPVKIDTTNPTFAPAISGTPGSGGWYRSPVTLVANASDSPSGIASVQAWPDGGPWQDVSSITFDADGDHDVIFRADDNAGNSSDSAMLTVKLDQTPPQSSFVSPAEGTSVVASGTLSLGGHVSDPTSGVSNVLLSLDDGVSWTPLTLDASGDWTYTWDVNAVPDGTYKLRVRTSDLAGNSEQTAHVTVEVDNRAPSVGITASFFISQIANIHITPAASPVTGARLTIAPLFGLPLRTFDFDDTNLPTTFQWDGLLADGSPAPIGLYTVTLEAWDAYGHTGRASGLLIIPAPPAPAATLTPIHPLPPTRTSTPTRTVTPTATATAKASSTRTPTAARTPTSTRTSTSTVTATATLTETPTPTSTRAAVIVVITGSMPEPPETEPLSTPGVLWGAEAAAVSAMVAAYALEIRRKREEEEARQREEAERLNAEARQREAEAAYLASLNARPTVVSAAEGGNLTLDDRIQNAKDKKQAAMLAKMTVEERIAWGQSQYHAPAPIIPANSNNSSSRTQNNYDPFTASAYQKGWEYFGEAWSIAINPRTRFWDREIALGYMAFWAGAHIALIAGLAISAWAVIAPGAATCAMNPACEQDVSQEVGSGTSTFIRYMSEAELRAVHDTGLLRGGNPGTTYMTTDIFDTVGGATSRLSLNVPPSVGVQFEIINSPNIIGPELIEALYGRMGLGTQFWTTDPVVVNILNSWDLLP